MAYRAIKQAVKNRGVPPDRFLDELIDWGRYAPDEIFVPNDKRDIYLSVWDTLGPYPDLLYRRAVMLEVMRVLAGFESSWRWTEGGDTTNPKSQTAATMEAGAWQVSADSMGWGPDLKKLVMVKLGSMAPNDFRRGMMHNHSLAMEYIARLLRRTVDANGPVRDHRIDPWLSRDAVTEFQRLVTLVGDFPAQPPNLRQTG